MQAQYDFIMSEVSQGRKVLAYNRKTIMKPVLCGANNVALIGGILYINSIPAMGWTIVRSHKLR